MMPPDSEDYAARAYGVAYTRSAGEVSTRG